MAKSKRAGDAQAARSGLRAHLKREGFWFGLSDESVKRRLRAKMGEERHEKLLDALDAKYYRGASITQVYRALNGRAEIHGLFSLQGDLTVAAFLACIEDADTFLRRPGACVADLGCLTGATTRWLAAKYPALSVVGVDREPHFLVDALHEAPANCAFLSRDYTALRETDGPFDALLCAVGVDLEHVEPSESQLWSADPSESTWIRELANALNPAFTGWNRATKPGGLAACALRVATPGELWAIANASSGAGWAIEATSLRRVNGGAGNLITAWQMSRAENSSALALTSFDSLLEGFAGIHGTRGPADRHAADLLRLRRLADREMLSRSSKCFDDGHWMLCEVGVHEGGGYTFWSATTGFRKLELSTRDEAEYAARTLAAQWIPPPEVAGLL